MSAYKSTLLTRTRVAKDTIAFGFGKPSHFVFKAGQHIDLTLSNDSPARSNGLTHTFSISSSPFADELVVTTRIRDTAFKRSLSDLPIGAEVTLGGPMGSFTLHNNAARPAVFLAGGIGIAPFLSILSYANGEKLRHPIFLFYANRYSDDAPFMEVLWNLKESNPHFRFIPTFTRITKNLGGWNGEIGHITGEMLHAHISSLQGPIYYLAGPPTMVAASRQTLNEIEVDEDDIRTEEFAGY